ncbi:MAG: DUF1064 domain-containing protein, partial [Planctomycetes bacterium]|nr:DUF1064 domain-containing protein [Planctomycetota bacterium]
MKSYTFHKGAGGVSKHVKVDGITFDSKAEARRYGQLKMLLNAKQITRLVVHPKWHFSTGTVMIVDTETHRRISYSADF